MKLVMTLLVRDEQDIIRQNIDFHRSQGVDYFIVTDNKSVDSTPKILEEYENQGVLHRIFEGDDNYNQRAWVTRMARMAYTDYGADWIINNDADEFWWPRTGTLKDVFKRLPDDCNVAEASRQNFIMTANAEPPFYRRMIYREKESLNPLGQPLPPKAAHRGCAGISVSQGNHRVSGFSTPNGRQADIDILHFPMRTYEQFINKIQKGGAAYERNVELPETVGITWRNLYKQLQENEGLQDYCAQHLYGTKKLRQALSAGTILEDRRLEKYLSQYYSHTLSDTVE